MYSSAQTAGSSRGGPGRNTCQMTCQPVPSAAKDWAILVPKRKDWPTGPNYVTHYDTCDGITDGSGALSPGQGCASLLFWNSVREECPPQAWKNIGSF
jgi:hypothetical protein